MPFNGQNHPLSGKPSGKGRYIDIPQAGSQGCSGEGLRYAGGHHLNDFLFAIIGKVIRNRPADLNSRIYPMHGLVYQNNHQFGSPPR